MPSANPPKRLPSSGSGRSGSATNPTRQLRCCCAKAPDRAQTVATAIAEMSVRRSITSFNHLVGAQHQARGDLVTDSLRRLEIDHQLETGRLLDREVGRLGTPQYLRRRQKVEGLG